MSRYFSSAAWLSTSARLNQLGEYLSQPGIGIASRLARLPMMTAALLALNPGSLAMRLLTSVASAAVVQIRAGSPP